MGAWLAFVLGLLYIPPMMFVLNRVALRRPEDDEAFRAAISPYGTPSGNPDPLEPNPVLVGRGEAVFASLLVNRRGACLIFVVGLAGWCAGLPFGYLLDGRDGINLYVLGGAIGIGVPIGGLLIYGQVVWWRTGAWPRHPWGRRSQPRGQRVLDADMRGHIAALRRWGFEVDDPGVSNATVPDDSSSGQDD